MQHINNPNLKIMDKQDLICNAIKDRNVIQFYYDGHLRIVEPFTLGILKTTRNTSLSAFRVGGYSESENSPPWRLYTLNKISSIKTLNRKAMQYRSGYNSRDSRMSMIICAV